MGKKQETIKNCPTELLGVQKQNDRNWKPKFKRRLDTAEEKLVNWKSDLKKTIQMHIQNERLQIWTME